MGRGREASRSLVSAAGVREFTRVAFPCRFPESLHTLMWPLSFLGPPLLQDDTALHSPRLAPLCPGRVRGCLS